MSVYPRKSTQVTASEVSTGRRWHAKWRALERYHMQFTSDDLKAIRGLLNAKTFVRRQSNTRTVHAVEYQGKRLLLVYHTGRHAILTFLPPDAEHKGKGGE